MPVLLVGSSAARVPDPRSVRPAYGVSYSVPSNGITQQAERALAKHPDTNPSAQTIR
jgi:hypothetical protein